MNLDAAPRAMYEWDRNDSLVLMPGPIWEDAEEDTREYWRRLWQIGLAAHEGEPR